MTGAAKLILSRMAGRCTLAVTIFLFFAHFANAQFGPTPVNVAAAQNRILAPTSAVSGAIVSQNDTQVAARIAGQLIRVAKVGTKVKAGEVFAQLRDPALDLRHAEQKARLDATQYRLDFLNSEVKRLQALAARDLSSKTDLDRTLSERNQAKAELAENKALLNQIELSQTYQNMRSPFDGIIVERLADEGELVGPGTVVVRLVQITDLEISARVPIASLAWVKPGKKLHFTSAIGEGSADVRIAVAVADNRTRLVEIRAMVEDGDWPVGLDVTISVPSGQEKQALAVPRDALVLRRDGARVFRISAENTAEQVMVETGIATEQWIEIRGDIKVGDNIVVRGAERLQPGSAVLVRDNNEGLVTL